MSFYEIDKTEEFLLSLLPEEVEPDLEGVRAEADKLFVPVISKTGAQLLKLLVSAVKPKSIFEIGTGVGYSGLLMLKNAALGANLHTVDMNEKNILTAKANFAKFGFQGNVTAHLGDASDILPLFSGEADFIFLDGPKGRYHEFYPYLKKILKSGGMLVCDNVLYSGRIIGKTETPHSKQSIMERLNMFLNALKSDDEMTTSVVPIGDGMSVSVKK